MTQYTENYRLELYEGTDKADLTDQYNVSMGILDGAMKGVVDDTDASVAGIRAELATTNSNLNATNINLAALDEKVDANQTAQATTNLNFQNEIDTLKTTVDAVPETYATQEALAALKTEVDKNTPLVEEHVNYFAELGVTDEASATDLHTQIDNTYQGLMSNTEAIEAIERQLSPWAELGTVTGSGDGQTVTFTVYSIGGFHCFVPTSGNFTEIAVERTAVIRINMFPGFKCHINSRYIANNASIQGCILRAMYDVKLYSEYCSVTITNMDGSSGFTPTIDLIPAFYVPVEYVGEPDNPNPPVGPDNPNPPVEPTPTATFGAAPSLETEGGNDGSTTAKFSGSIAGKKLTVNKLSATYEFSSRLGEDVVYMPTSKIVVATVENGTGVEVPTSVKVSSSALESSQTYPLTYVGGVLSFTPPAQTRSLGAHTGGTSTKELTLVMEFIANGGSTTPNPPATDPEEPKLNGTYPIALSGSRKPGRSNAIEPFEIRGTISYNEGVVSGVALKQGSGVLCVLKSDNPAYVTALVEVSGLEITGQHVPDTLTFEAQLFQDNVRATQTVEFTKTGDKLVANNFKLIGNMQAAQNGFGQAQLSFIPA